MTTHTQVAPSGQRPELMAGEGSGIERKLRFVVTAMVSVSFKTAPWQSLHALAWIVKIASMIRERRWTVPGPPRWAIPWGLFAGWVVLSSALGPGPADALYDTKKLLNLLALFLVGAVFRTPTHYARALASIASISAILSIIGLYQFATTANHIGARSHGVSHHMTHSGMLLITICMVVPLLTFRKGRSNLLWWGYTGLASLALLATLTRSAWIGLVVGLTVVLLFKNPRWLLALPLLPVILFATVPEIRDRTRSIVDTRNDYSNVQRLGMYRTGLRMIADKPIFGLGGRGQVVEQFADYEETPPRPPRTSEGLAPQPYGRPDHLHSNLLQIPAAFGLPALAAWLVALGVWLREVFRLLPPRRDVHDEAGRLYRNILLSSLAGAAGFLTMGLLEYNFGDSEVSPLFFLALSMPFVLGRPPALEATGAREETESREIR